MKSPISFKFISEVILRALDTLNTKLENYNQRSRRSPIVQKLQLVKSPSNGQVITKRNTVVKTSRAKGGPRSEQNIFNHPRKDLRGK